MDNHPETRPRLALAALARALQVMPVVVVTGARQTGKSTLVAAAGDRVVHSLDDLVVRDRARREPMAFAGSDSPITIDEVQREPDLLLAIKRLVDLEGPHRTAGRFLLTGSANLLLMKRVAESLAGRAVYLTLWPMTHRERRGGDLAGSWSALLAAPPAEWPALLSKRPADRLDWRGEVQRGGFPVPALTLETAEARQTWFEGYVQTYLERDLRELSAVENLADFEQRDARLHFGAQQYPLIIFQIGCALPFFHQRHATGVALEEKLPLIKCVDGVNGVIAESFLHGLVQRRGFSRFFPEKRHALAIQIAFQIK